MAFYMQMLREEEELMGNTGFDPGMVADPDDKYAIDLKDVAKTIEDINDDYADQSSQEELDGQDLHEDPVAECMIAIYESEHNWNQIMQDIGQREVLEAARGREMVMEAVDVKGFIASAKAFFVKMWKKITAIVKNWIDNATAAFRTNKSFEAKYGKNLSAGMDAYFADSKNKGFEGYKFNGSMGAVAEFMKSYQKAQGKVDSINKIAQAVANGNYDTRAIEGDSADVFRGELIAGRGNGAEIDAGSFRKALKDHYFGDKVTLGKGDINVDRIKAVLRGDDDIKGVKKAYAEMKKDFDNTLKALSQLEKAVLKSGEKGSYGDDRSAAMSAVTKAIGTEKDKKHATDMAFTTMLKALRAEKAQSRKIANAFIFALNKGARKDKVAAADADYKKVRGESGFFGGLELL